MCLAGNGGRAKSDRGNLLALAAHRVGRSNGPLKIRRAATDVVCVSRVTVLFVPTTGKSGVMLSDSEVIVVDKQIGVFHY
jgi:hypothetical protein